MSVELKAEEVSAPLIVSWHPGIAEWTSESFFTPKTKEERQCIALTIDPLADLPAQEFVGVYEFTEVQANLVAAWIEARMNYLCEELGWSFTRSRRVKLAAYCRMLIWLGLDPEQLPLESYEWPAISVGL